MERDAWLAMSDEALHRACQEDFYRASGPGGQKRNKTESAVRLRHPECSICVVATESRMREENRRRAVRRMREAIAYRIRQPSGADGTHAPMVRAGELDLGKRDPKFLLVAATVLDLLDSNCARLNDVATLVGVSTGRLVKFLRTTPDLWEATQQLRQKHDQSPLR